MHVKFHCPHCSGALETDAHVNGYDSNCPHCGKTIRTPGSGIYPGLVIDDMRIEKALGRGSMGDVYLATQVILERKVALKILNSSLVNTPQAIERFMKEVRLLAKLTHPNIVSAYSAGEAMGVHYLAMSYVKGETMASRLQRKGKLPEEDALAVALCVARALNYAWERHHLLHRDIKPGNIMVDQDGEIKLMDMGLSKSLLDDGGEGTQTGMLLGTPHYMSPEQADCRPDIDCRADIYGLGASLYHMVTGAPPYAGSTVPEILDAQMKSALTPARERNPQVTRATEMLLQKMMQKDRAKRQQNWDELIADISQILIEEFPQSSETETPFRGRHTGPKDSMPEPKKSRGVLVGFLLLILAVLGGLDFWLMKNPDDAARLRERITDIFTDATSRLGIGKPQQPETPPATHEPAVTGIPSHVMLMEFAGRRLERNRKNNELPPALATLPPERIQAIVDALSQLDEKVAPLAKQGKYIEAAKLYEDYNGAFAPESVHIRRAAARSLLAAAIRGTNAPPPKLKD